MRKAKKVKFIMFLIIIITLLFGTKVFANNIANYFEEVDYTEEYKKYIELSEEQKQNVIQPKMYHITNTTVEVKNLLKKMRIVGSSVETSYSLKNVIPNNVIVKNQGKTNTCWAFSTLSSLETNLALKNKQKTYDFSEKHMNYGTTRIFSNNEINKYGYNRNATNMGAWVMAINYLTNGMGAIPETEMVFDNNTTTIDISQIQNKTVSSQVYDTVEFPSYKITDDLTQIKQQMKDHIKNNGSIYAVIHGATLGTTCCNIKTGAIYCNDAENCKVDHGVSIIGWDDNYSIDNFNSTKKPTKNGAWIIKNSWGEKLEYTLAQMKSAIFSQFPDECASRGWSEASQIPDDFAKNLFINNGYTIENDKASLKIGDYGIMYVSYEDVNIYSALSGIVNASDSIDYENIYQYNELSYSYYITYKQPSVYLGNIFNKQTDGKEYLTQVSINAVEPYTCKVYVNPDGTNMAKNAFKQIQLKAGDSETINTGYHTLEFLEPLEITGDNFVVVLEIQGTNGSSVTFGLEANIPNSYWDSVQVESSKCFLTYENYFDVNQWQDLSKLSDFNFRNGDTTIKAFTTSKLNINSLKNIEIESPPTKTSYFTGENFDKTGMIVKAVYTNGSSKEITDYTIENGTTLKKEQTSVTISYEGMSVEQEITVQDKKVEELENIPETEVQKTIKFIEINKLPTKTKYIQNKENLDLTGGSINVIYSDGTKEEILMTSNKITVQGFDNTKVGEIKITLIYETKTINFEIEIQAEEKQPVNSDIYNANCNITEGKLYIYTEESEEKYALIKVVVDNITRNLNNDIIEYYYYLSTNQEEENITDWVKINEIQNSKNQLEFTINTENLKNIKELSNSDVLYLYIKEIAIVGEKQKIAISNSILMETDITPEVYIDNINIKEQNKNSNISITIAESNEEENQQNNNLNILEEDNTVASGKIPQTGQTVGVIILISCVSVIGTIVYIKYKKLNKKMK